MSNTYVIGDLHGEIDFNTVSNATFKEQGLEIPDKDSILIQVGDLGIIWDPVDSITPPEEYLRKWFAKKPWRMITAGGNHENWERVFNLPLVWVEWLNGFAYEYIKGRVYYALRGTIYTINDKTYFFAGGALSHDAPYRTEGKSIWKDLEVMSLEERDKGLEFLKKVDFKVDYVVTHTGPNDILNLWGYYDRDTTRQYLEGLLGMGLTFKKWFFGHLHLDKKMQYRDYELYCLYKEILEV